MATQPVRADPADAHHPRPAVLIPVPAGDRGIWRRADPRLAETVYGPAASAASGSASVSARLLLAWAMPGPVAGEPLPFTIDWESPASIAYRLEQAGLIADAGLFSSTWCTLGSTAGCRQLYMLEPGLPPVEMLTSCRMPPGEVGFTFCRGGGWRKSPPLPLWIGTGRRRSCDSEECSSVGPPGAGYQQPEGYILPGEYISRNQWRIC